MREGTQIILVNPRRQVLMYLRDDKPEIPYPGMWSLLGGMLEDGETPAECVRREIEEEIGVILDPTEIQHVRTRDLHYGVEHTFFARIAFEIDDVVLTEGQRLGWFGESDAAATGLAYEDNAILAEFFATPPAAVPVDAD
ncbi:NUDIX domain-containing protein [Nocardia panacis]|uniref:NUDIX domain-containing protein n=1 Tax=Nocardia panacis TaxID=2340916 RepID=A0A3A4KK63_9NOCA|nr:NUDIX domain-containing protein [Nocardia panacis]RJO74190.1 NUDIX domain-containing protein [Nocardia panacis]